MATLPVFRTWVAGEIVTAAFMNTNVRDAGNFFLSWPVFEGRQTVAQSIATGATLVPLLFDAEDIDTDGGHSTVTNTDRYTPQTAGRFQISGKISCAASAVSYRQAALFKNGAAITGGDTVLPASAVNHRQSTPIMTAVANGSTDYFQIAMAQNSGGALLTTVAAAEQPTFSVRMVGSV